MTLGTGAANITGILFQIGSQRYLLFDFNGTDVTGWTPELQVLEYAGARRKSISLTIGNGLSYPIYETDQILASFSEANTSIKEGEYYLELRRRDLDQAVFSTKAIFSHDSPAGDAQTLSFTNEEQTISITLGNLISQPGGGGEWGDITGTLSDQTDLSIALALKANLASPTFTGTPAAPTAAATTNTTQIATTAFVQQEAWKLASGGTLTAANTVDLNSNDLSFTNVGNNGVIFSRSSANPADGAGVEIQEGLNTNGAILNMYLTKASPSASDRIYEFHGFAKNGSGTKTQMVAIYSEVVSTTAGSEGGRQLMNITSAGSFKEYFRAEPSSSVSGDVDLTLGYNNRIIKFTPNALFTNGLFVFGNNVASGIGEMRWAYASGGAGVINGALSGTKQMSLGWGNQATFEGTINVSSGRQNYWFDDVSSAVLGGFGSSNFYIGPSGSVYGLKVGRLTSGTGITVATTGNAGFGQTSPTAKVHLGAGTTAANTAPMKFTSGTNMTTAETGAVEYDGTNLFFTRTGTTRESIICSNAVNSVSPTAQNRTITVVIAGTTLYITAKTTND